MTKILKFNKLKNNCYFIEINNIIVLISYESIIGFIYNDILYISEYYIKYSKTTTNHINLFKNNLSFNTEKIINNNDMYLFFENIQFNNKIFD